MKNKDIRKLKRPTPKQASVKLTQRMKNHFQRYWQLYVLIAPAVIYFLIFHYGPMYGVQIAFKDYKPSLGILDSPRVGFKHFKRFFNSYYFSDLMRNTLQISLYELVVEFPMPIILALLFNELRNGFFKKFAQTVTYAPHFISTVVIVGMLVAFLSPSTGLLNHLLASLGFERVAFLEEASWFKTIYVFSGIWQNTGWNTIIYMAALLGVDPQLYEAASIDGASRWQKLIYINLPALIPTMVILLILNFGSIMAMGYEKILLMQNALNISESNVIATFTYKQGLLDGNYSYAAAIGLFNSAINAILLVVVNKFSRKLSRISLW